MKPRIIIRDRSTGLEEPEHRASARGYGPTPEEALKVCERALDGLFGHDSWEPTDVEYDVETSEETGNVVKVEAWLSAKLNELEPAE